MDQIFPSSQDWERISSTYDWLAVINLIRILTSVENETITIDEFAKSHKVDEWLEHLEQRVLDAQTSYVSLTFFYEQGIPDSRWFGIAEGEEEPRYFPDLTEQRHYKNKYFFRYFSENYFTRIFSAWDTIAHVLNTEHGWGEKRPDFGSIMNKIRRCETDLYTRLKSEVIDDPAYIKAHQIRKDLIHNTLPGKVRERITSSEIEKDGVKWTTLSGGVGTYITSSEIREAVHGSLAAFVRTLEILHEFFQKKRQVTQ